ncbi:hypothetical protein MAJ_05324, partial [Metarhizium majus ARSEF 297]
MSDSDSNDSITQHWKTRKAAKLAGKLTKEEKNRVAEEVKREIERIWLIDCWNKPDKGKRPLRDLETNEIDPFEDTESELEDFNPNSFMAKLQEKRGESSKEGARLEEIRKRRQDREEEFDEEQLENQLGEQFEEEEEEEEQEEEDEEEGEEEQEEEDEEEGEEEDDEDHDNAQEVKFEAPEDLTELEEIREVKSLVDRFGPPGRDNAAKAFEHFGIYRMGNKTAAAWTAQDALYTGLRDFTQAGGRLNDEGISLVREDSYYPLWREVALLIIHEYKQRDKRSLKEGKQRSQAEIGLIRRIKKKVRNAAIGFFGNGRIEIRGQSYPADSNAVLPSRAQVLATRYLDKLGSVNDTLFGDLYSLGRHDLGFITLSNDQKMGGVVVVAESPAATTEIKNTKDEIAAIKDRVAQEFCKQTILIRGKAKESKEAAENARVYAETEIGKINANMKTKNENLSKRMKESFALRDKEIGQLKEDNKKLSEEFAKLLKIVNETKAKSSDTAMKPPPLPKAKQPSPAKTPKRSLDEDKVSPSPKKPKPSKPSPGKGEKAGEAAGKATGKTTKGESKSASQPPEEEEVVTFIW